MSKRKKTLVRSAAVVTSAAILSLGLTGGVAHASDAPPPPPDASSLPPDRVAVISPAMSSMLWGGSIFVNIGCAVMTAYMASTMAGFGDANSAQLTDTTTDGCAKFASTGGQFVLQGMSAIQPLARINPYVNPGIDGFANAVAEFGRSNEALLTPFGPTIQSSANSIAFFKGSNPK